MIAPRILHVNEPPSVHRFLGQSPVGDASVARVARSGLVRISVGRSWLPRVRRAPAPMSWDFPPSIAAKCREFQQRGNSSSARVKKCALVRRVRRAARAPFSPARRNGNNPEKIISLIFAALPSRPGLPLEGIRRGLIENPSPRVNPSRGDRRGQGEGERSRWAHAGWIRLAFRCGQREGTRVIALEIIGELVTAGLWTEGHHA